MRGYTWIGVLLLALLVGIGGGMIGYNVGLSVAANVAAGSGATVVYPAVGWGFGFPFFGFIFFIVLLFVVFGAFRRAAWGGHHGYGPGSGGYWKNRGDAFEEWHRRQHGDAADTQARTPDAR